MRATAIVPVKRFSAAKRRLQPGVDRAALVEQMLGIVFSELRRATMLDGPIVVTGEPRAAELAADFGFEVIDDRDVPSHSEAALIGIEAALARGAECVALLPGDCPQIRVSEVDNLLEGLAAPSVTIVPDHHGTGTNGLILAPPDAIRPAFGAGSRERHAELAKAAGIPHSVVVLPSLALDIDTPEDLALWDASN
jgi:2-phospho-L-lactate guanylyltransferase